MDSALQFYGGSCSQGLMFICISCTPTPGASFQRSLNWEDLTKTLLYTQCFSLLPAFLLLPLSSPVGPQNAGAFFSEMSVVKRFPLSVLIHLTLAWCPLNGGEKKKLQSWYLYLPVTYTISANKVLVITFSLACCPNRPLGNLAA